LSVEGEERSNVGTHKNFGMPFLKSKEGFLEHPTMQKVGTGGI
jgi:hypothetical protein